MPIYEFYCPDCHTVFSFLARSSNTKKRPTCPRCSRDDLERRASRFAVSRGRGEPETEGDDSGVDEARIERAMAELASEADGLDESDPRQMARLMRKLHESAGLPLGSGIEEAIRRLEAGEDPDRIEEEMGDLLDADDDGSELPAGGGRLRGMRRRLLPPAVDETLHEL